MHMHPRSKNYFRSSYIYNHTVPMHSYTLVYFCTPDLNPLSIVLALSLPPSVLLFSSVLAVGGSDDCVQVLHCPKPINTRMGERVVESLPTLFTTIVRPTRYVVLACAHTMSCVHVFCIIHPKKCCILFVGGCAHTGWSAGHAHPASAPNQHLHYECSLVAAV